MNEVTDDTVAQVLEENEWVLIDVYANWCQPCKKLTPIIEQVAAETDDVKFVKLNADENQATLEKYGIRGLPTILLFYEGQLQEVHTGLVTKETLKEIVS